MNETRNPNGLYVVTRPAWSAPYADQEPVWELIEDAVADAVATAEANAEARAEAKAEKAARKAARKIEAARKAAVRRTLDLIGMAGVGIAVLLMVIAYLT